MCEYWQTSPIPEEWNCSLDYKTVLLVDYEHIDDPVFNERTRHNVHGCWAVEGWDEISFGMDPHVERVIGIRHLASGKRMTPSLDHPILKSKRATVMQVSDEYDRVSKVKREEFDQERDKLLTSYNPVYQRMRK